MADPRAINYVNNLFSMMNIMDIADMLAMTRDLELAKKKKKKESPFQQFDRLIHSSTDSQFIQLAALLLSKLPADETIYIVSVGAGNCVNEKMLITALASSDLDASRFQLICVDPAPTQYDPSQKVDDINIDYATVDELIEAQPEVVSNCIVVCLWPYPQSGDTIKINDGWDYDALHVLDPHANYIFYGPCGSSGSEKLISYLQSEYTDPSDTYPVDGIDAITDRHKIVARISLKMGTGFGFTGKMLELVTTIHHRLLSSSDEIDTVTQLIETRLFG